MNDELHIASFIVQARVDAVAGVAAAARRLPSAEIAACAGGKIVLLVEAPTSRDVMAVIEALQSEPGVLAVNLVYHHAEARDLLNEEIPDEHAA